MSPCEKCNQKKMRREDEFPHSVLFPLSSLTENLLFFHIVSILTILIKLKVYSRGAFKFSIFLGL